MTALLKKPLKLALVQLATGRVSRVLSNITSLITRPPQDRINQPTFHELVVASLKQPEKELH